jgi:NTP pyrophosphatase (non-canonical NTP hydrolase)
VKDKAIVDPDSPRVHLPFMGHFVTYQEQVKQLFEILAKEAHKTAADQDFWYDRRSSGDTVAMLHKEISDLYEATRYANKPSEKIPEFTLVEEHTADILIRVLDWAEAHKLKLSGALLAKMKYNKGQIKTKPKR